MDFITLDSNYRAKDTFDNWESLIWTERWRTYGDFVLRTYDIRNAMALMPLGSCVSLQDTRELCIVENWEIEKDDKGASTLKISGRSFETFFENRITMTTLSQITNSSNETNTRTITNDSPGGSAAALVDNAKNGTVSTNDVIPGVDGTVTMDADPDDTGDRDIARGDTYSEFVRLLDEANCGVRNLRPINGTATTIFVNVYRYYSGVDFLTDVALDVLSGHFTGPVKYTWSIKDYKTAVYVASKNGALKVFNTGASGYTGLDHRVALLDHADITTAAGTSLNSKLKAKGKSYLAKHKKYFAIDGKISPDIPYKYNVDYGLGDRFKIRGDYGAEDTVQVVEYTRAQDKSGGEVGYPTYIT